MVRLRSHVLGKWQEGSGDELILQNPSTEETVALARAGGLDFAAILAFGREKGGPALAAMTFAERAELLKKLSKGIYEIREELIEASVLNGGTTRSDAKFDIDGATGTLAYYASFGKELGDTRFLVEGEGQQLLRSPRFWGHHIKMPRRGVAVHINAFNFPAWGMAEKLAVALLAGVPVVSKPGMSTALVASRMVERVVELDVLPEGALQYVAAEPGDLLSHLRSQDLLSFTGSGSTGALLRSLKSVVEPAVRVNVEADSLNAAVLGPDVEPGSETWALFVHDVIREITQKTGQKCTAARRILVPSRHLEQIRSDLSEGLASVVVGNPALDEVTMGPLATAAQLRSVKEGVGRLVESGAAPVFGRVDQVEVRGAPAGKGFFISPILLVAEKPASATAVHELEVFGPVSTLMPYESTEEAFELVALGNGGLLCSLYSDERNFVSQAIFKLAPLHGRIFVGSEKIAGQAGSPGMVLPASIHGGPGRAGGGEELGGLRAIDFYLQRTALQGDRALLDFALKG